MVVQTKKITDIDVTRTSYYRGGAGVLRANKVVTVKVISMISEVMD